MDARPRSKKDYYIAWERNCWDSSIRLGYYCYYCNTYRYYCTVDSTGKRGQAVVDVGTGVGMAQMVVDRAEGAVDMAETFADKMVFAQRDDTMAVLNLRRLVH